MSEAENVEGFEAIEDDELVQYNFRIEQNYLNDLKKSSEKFDVPVSQLIRNSIRCFLLTDKEAKKVQDQTPNLARKIFDVYEDGLLLNQTERIQFKSPTKTDLKSLIEEDFISSYQYCSSSNVPKFWPTSDKSFEPVYFHLATNPRWKKDYGFCYSQLARFRANNRLNEQEDLKVIVLLYSSVLTDLAAKNGKKPEYHRWEDACEKDLDMIIKTISETIEGYGGNVDKFLINTEFKFSERLKDFGDVVESTLMPKRKILVLPKSSQLGFIDIKIDRNELWTCNTSLTNEVEEYAMVVCEEICMVLRDSRKIGLISMAD